MSAMTQTSRPSEAAGHVTVSSSCQVTSLDFQDSAVRECALAMATADADSAEEGELEDEENHAEGSSSVAAERPVTLALSSCGGGAKRMKRKVLVAPVLSVSLGRSESGDFHSAFLSPSPGDEDDGGPDFDLDAMETPSDSESLRFPVDDLDLEDDLQEHSTVFSCESVVEAGLMGLGALEREDVVDSQGTRWRSFSAGPAPHDGQVNMSVLEPFLRVLSHGGYYGDGMNDIIVFSSCYLPKNTLENYHYVMDNLFRYLVGTLDLMVCENYVIVFLCAGGIKEKLPGIGWLKECYHTIAWRLRKNLKGVFVVHPTWAIKALITIIKPFISSKFSRKLEFVDSLQELSARLPTEHVQIPDCVRTYDDSLSS
ncbi:bcl-2/adenovirus E1B 19 kDa-interacting protein 2-like protein isoform X1 [Phycodurus eques]|uniref:bcl-2/adenovirus E1B 19 kDa-interacting protein 2-like protein isoform X1 n=1 Tax=Phycodurus eques TaxID=693459 RepID=UPI002ACD350E|nr:bcl-2/adenovirus E1B 19 kDa-interacting protein 2-like protein isoform X1 [Phycodurus eques]